MRRPTLFSGVFLLVASWNVGGHQSHGGAGGPSRWPAGSLSRARGRGRPPGSLVELEVGAKKTGGKVDAAVGQAAVERGSSKDGGGAAAAAKIREEAERARRVEAIKDAAKHLGAAQDRHHRRAVQEMQNVDKIRQNFRAAAAHVDSRATRSSNGRYRMPAAFEAMRANLRKSLGTVRFVERMASLHAATARDPGMHPWEQKRAYPWGGQGYKYTPSQFRHPPPAPPPPAPPPPPATPIGNSGNPYTVMSSPPAGVSTGFRETGVSIESSMRSPDDIIRHRTAMPDRPSYPGGAFREVGSGVMAPQQAATAYGNPGGSWTGYGYGYGYGYGQFANRLGGYAPPSFGGGSVSPYQASFASMYGITNDILFQMPPPPPPGQPGIPPAAAGGAPPPSRPPR